MASPRRDRQERVGGPPTAVAIVLDAAVTGNIHVRRWLQSAAASTAGILRQCNMRNSELFSLCDISNNELDMINTELLRRVYSVTLAILNVTWAILRPIPEVPDWRNSGCVKKKSDVLTDVLTPI